ncbi:hypothetical protein EBZ57_02790 [bacterium]|jgi:hypothetical protein|nr:hypothetical protein [bacterium]
MKLSNKKGFSAVELLAGIAVIVVIVIAGGYIYIKNNNEKTTQANTAPSAPAGTTQNINQITSNDASLETSVEKETDAKVQSQAGSYNSAVNQAGGSYNESSL